VLEVWDFREAKKIGRCRRKHTVAGQDVHQCSSPPQRAHQQDEHVRQCHGKAGGVEDCRRKGECVLSRSPHTHTRRLVCPPTVIVCCQLSITHASCTATLRSTPALLYTVSCLRRFLITSSALRDVASPAAHASLRQCVLASRFKSLSCLGVLQPPFALQHLDRRFPHTVTPLR
jgi:hypothetical protein